MVLRGLSMQISFHKGVPVEAAHVPCVRLHDGLVNAVVIGAGIVRETPRRVVQWLGGPALELSLGVELIGFESLTIPQSFLDTALL